VTIGSPIAITISNKDFENWSDAMSPFGAVTERAKVTQPRPGHADLAGVLKTGTDDVRDILERASARETAARVAAGAIAKAMLREAGVTVGSYVDSIGGVRADVGDPDKADLDAAEKSDVRCPDDAAAREMRSAIDEARAEGESLGGTFVVLARGLVPGLGGYATASQRLDARLAAAIVSIPAIKGVEFGEGFALAEKKGSGAHDEIVLAEGSFRRTTNHAGGLEGGMSNGETLIVRAVMKPIPTLMTPLRTVDLATLQPADASKERSDVCAVPAASVVAEAEVALVLADSFAAKFGSDSMADLLGALDAYRERISR
jgi:chorismate synthase